MRVLVRSPGQLALLRRCAALQPDYPARYAPDLGPPRARRAAPAHLASRPAWPMHPARTVRPASLRVPHWHAAPDLPPIEDCASIRQYAFAGRVRRIRTHAPHAPGRVDADGRSEEHTSELQSLMRISYAVFCL